MCFSVHANMSHQFILQLYMKLPKIISYLTGCQAKRMVDGGHISDWTGSVLDCMSHTLLTALAATPRQKSWSAKSRELELCARKMAAVHPILVLRQLPLLASSLMGWCDLEFGQFKSGHHMNLYTQVMGLLELLQPHVFNEEHRKGLEDTLANYFQCFHVSGGIRLFSSLFLKLLKCCLSFFQHYCTADDLTSLLNRFALFLQAYVIHDEQHALKYLQKHAHLLQ